MRNRFFNTYQAHFAKIVGFSSGHPHPGPLPEGQGQRTLSCFSSKDLHQEIDAPTGEAAFHSDAVFAGVLFQ